MAADNDFFKKQTPSSRIKASIVSEYFPQYCQIIRRAHEPQMFRYIDLFAGPGIYEDGSISTPIMLAKNVASIPSLKGNVQFVFNDLSHIDELRSNFESEFPQGTFPKGVYFRNKEVGAEEKIYEYLKTSTMKRGVDGKVWNESPSLLFFDPFGYSGMRTDVLASFLKNWGNELFLFINSKRINPALENDKFEELLRLWFPSRFDTLKKGVRTKRTVSERLDFILNNLGDEFRSLIGGSVYCCSFRFQEEDSRTTSHFILHVTKGVKGFELVKSVYNKYANEDLALTGSNTYTFDPKKCEGYMPLFETNDAVETLRDTLCKEFKGRTISALCLFESHHKDSKYSREHYTAALRLAVKDGMAEAHYTDNKKHTVSALIDSACVITFK